MHITLGETYRQPRARGAPFERLDAVQRYILYDTARSVQLAPLMLLPEGGRCLDTVARADRVYDPGCSFEARSRAAALGCTMTGRIVMWGIAWCSRLFFGPGDPSPSRAELQIPPGLGSRAQ